jgi:hypothetical protein
VVRRSGGSGTGTAGEVRVELDRTSTWVTVEDGAHTPPRSALAIGVTVRVRVGARRRAAREGPGCRVRTAQRGPQPGIGAQFVTNTRYRRERSARLYRSYRSSTVHGTVVATVEGGAVETLVETVFCYHDGHGK